MKRINLIIILILLIPFISLHSQFKLNYGIKAGAIFAHQVSVDEGSEGTTSGKWGLGAGAFLETSFNKSISIAGELDYLQEGWSGYNYDVPQKYSINVLSVPVMLKLKAQAGKFTPYLLAGPRLDFIVRFDTEVNTTENAKSPVFGITFGAGVERIFYKNISLLAEIRYNYDFDSDLRYYNSVESYSSTNYSRSLAFLVGIKF